ncbi:MAG: hypothetical protein ACXV7D_13120 [Thermoanaerobaculia bacterium]
MESQLALKVAILTVGKPQRQTAADSGIPETPSSEIGRGWTTPRDGERDTNAAALGKQAAELFVEADEGEPVA